MFDRAELFRQMGRAARNELDGSTLTGDMIRLLDAASGAAYDMMMGADFPGLLVVLDHSGVPRVDEAGRALSFKDRLVVLGQGRPGMRSLGREATNAQPAMTSNTSMLDSSSGPSVTTELQGDFDWEGYQAVIGEFVGSVAADTDRLRHLSSEE